MRICIGLLRLLPCTDVFALTVDFSKFDFVVLFCFVVVLFYLVTRLLD